ncbi:MAG: bifunctional UDP-sugar hydrolase/5'-nucleotidase [Eubacteriales bacterium]|nr:bifunctional UDP-sugar hydrolase/5'-nucleotidase [Eubacteriales bacterium]
MKKHSAKHLLLAAAAALVVTACAGGGGSETAAGSTPPAENKEIDTANNNEKNGSPADNDTAGSYPAEGSGAEIEDGAEVIILYTNDVHTYINNTKKDKDGNETPGLDLAAVAGLRNDLRAAGENVILVDAGDHVQGTAYGGLDEGRSVIDIMNAAGYQAAAIGNHEFDYGQFRFFSILEQADFPYVSCNFYKTENGEPVVSPYTVIESGGIRVAFVGISTPESITKSTPIYFMDEKQQNFLYGFRGGEDGTELYEAVQKAVDAAWQEADHVIGLSHLGVDPSSAPYRSIDVIAHVTGLEAVIDGHSHTVMEQEWIRDAKGHEVLLTQTGAYLGNVGKMIIGPDGISSELISEYDKADEKVQALTQKWIDEVSAKLGEEIAYSDIEFVINDPADPQTRIIRNRETNLGDFAADSYYYYFNEVCGLKCDAAIINGGGIRSGMEPGKVTCETAKTIQPFGNVACLVEMTGQQLLEALEMGVMTIGEVDEKTGTPAENGGFLHAAGFRYTVDTTVSSTVGVDKDGLWTAPPSGEYRVKEVEIYNRETGAYEPLEPDRTYNVAGINYLLRNMGCGLTMLAQLNPVQDYVQEDYLVFAEYAKAFKAGADGTPHICTEDSPLSDYEGYMLNYEDPYGAGRILIVTEDQIPEL